MPEITLDRVREAVDYDPTTGWFTWRIKTGKSVVIGKRAGSVDPNGFRYIRIDKKDFLAQRLAWFYVNGEWPKQKLKHQDEDRDNNRLVNIIEVAGSGKFPSQFDFSTKEGRYAYRRAHRAENTDMYRDKDLRKNFGIDLTEYRRMLLAQGGVCAICKQPEMAQRNGRAKWLAVDHDHVTGAVRGLLCSNCNPMIGYGKDDPARLRAGAEYLEDWSRRSGGLTVIATPAEDGVALTSMSHPGHTGDASCFCGGDFCGPDEGDDQ